MNYQNKTVVITGGAKGIGAAIAQSFFDAGAHVAVLDVAADASNINNERWMFLHLGQHIICRPGIISR